MNARDDRLHEALTGMGTNLPEPTAPARVREQIEQVACAVEAPIVRTALWRRASVGALGALAATFAIAAGVLYVQNVRLSQELSRLDRGVTGITPVAGTPPLMAINFYHDGCPVAGEVMPRFAELAKAHADDDVLFVTVDMSEHNQAQAMKLTEALSCGFVYTCDNAEISTGTVVLADMRNQSVIKSFRGADQIDQVEEALDEALITCRQEQASDG